MKFSDLFHAIINNILFPIRLTQSEEEDLATALLQQQHSSPRHDIQRKTQQNTDTIMLIATHVFLFELILSSQCCEFIISDNIL